MPLTAGLRHKKEQQGKTLLLRGKVVGTEQLEETLHHVTHFSRVKSGDADAFSCPNSFMDPCVNEKTGHVSHKQ